MNPYSRYNEHRIFLFLKQSKGEDYFMVGPRRPVHSSIIPMGWISMIRIHEDGQGGRFVSFVPEEDAEEKETEDNLNVKE